MTTDNVSWEKFNDEMQLTIHGVTNLSIIGAGDIPVKINVDPIMAYVMVFQMSENITLKNIEAGFVSPKNKEDADAGALCFVSCTNIDIINTILLGSGMVGLKLEDVDGLRFINSTIKDCLTGIFTASNTKNVLFDQAHFTNNQGYNLINIDGCNNISLTNCDISGNKTGTDPDVLWGFGLFNIDNSSGILIKDSRITNNSTQYFLRSRAKNLLTVNHTLFKDNGFFNGVYQDSVFEKLFMEYSAISDLNLEQIIEFYKKLEYMSRKINDPAKLDQPKKRLLYLSYWKDAVERLEAFLKRNPNHYEAESILGKCYQIGYQLNINDAYEQAQTHLKKAIRIKPDISGNDHLALGILYCSKLFTLSAGENNKEPKLIVKAKLDPKLIPLAETELLKDNSLPGTSNIYLFLLYYFQGKFNDAMKQANQYLALSPSDQLMRKLRVIAKRRIGKPAPGELNVYIDREKLKRLFDFYFVQGGESVIKIESDSQRKSAYNLLFKIGTQPISLEDEEEKINLPKLLGKPISQEVEVSGPDAFPYAGISFKTVKYEGLVIVFYQVKEKSYRICNIRVNSKDYPTAIGLRVGDSFKKLQDTYPAILKDESDNYVLFDSGSGFEMIFEIDNDCIKSISVNEQWD